MGKAGGISSRLLADESTLEYHRLRFERDSIPLREGQSVLDPLRAQRIVFIDPEDKFLPEWAEEFSEAGRNVLVIGARYGGQPYSAKSDYLRIALWPKGSVLGRNEEHFEERPGEADLLPWVSAMSKDSLAVSQLFGAQVVVGLDGAGGMLAAEVAERMKIGFVLLMNRVLRVPTEEMIRSVGKTIADIMANIWAEQSAVLASNAVMLGAGLRIPETESVRVSNITDRMLFRAYGGDDMINVVDETYRALMRQHPSDEFDATFGRLEGRAYHRTAQVWRGDMPKITPGHKKAGRLLMEKIVDSGWVQSARDRGRRLVITCGGESGSGKTEIATYLQMLMMRQGIRAVMIPGDAFFRRNPTENHNRRLELFAQGGEEALGEYLMSDEEIDYKRLEAVLKAAADREKNQVLVPSDARRIDVVADADGVMERVALRYDKVPVDLEGVDVVLVDLTTSAKLESADVRVMYGHTYEDKLRHIRERNQGRDPGHDFEFTRTVLRLEHEKIVPLRPRANVMFDTDYNITVVTDPFANSTTQLSGGGGTTAGIFVDNPFAPGVLCSPMQRFGRGVSF